MVPSSGSMTHVTPVDPSGAALSPCMPSVRPARSKAPRSAPLLGDIGDEMVGSTWTGTRWRAGASPTLSRARALEVRAGRQPPVPAEEIRLRYRLGFAAVMAYDRAPLQPAGTPRGAAELGHRAPSTSITRSPGQFPPFAEIEVGHRHQATARATAPAEPSSLRAPCGGTVTCPNSAAAAPGFGLRRSRRDATSPHSVVQGGEQLERVAASRAEAAGGLTWTAFSPSPLSSASVRSQGGAPPSSPRTLHSAESPSALAVCRRGTSKSVQTRHVLAEMLSRRRRAAIQVEPPRSAAVRSATVPAPLWTSPARCRSPGLVP